MRTRFLKSNERSEAKISNFSHKIEIFKSKKGSGK